MKYLRPLCIMLFCVLTAATDAAAQKGKIQKKAHPASAHKPKAAPAKAPVYYPDFYTFYNPAGKNYTYWKDQQWTTSPEKPAFMKTVQKGKTRVQILHDESMNAHPEDHFDQYMKLYPPVGTMPGTTVPVITVDRVGE